MTLHPTLITDKALPSLPQRETLPKLQTIDDSHSRPETPRRATVPEASSPLSGLPSSTLPYRPRTRSPFARGHARSRSSAGSLSAPQMTRAYSSPSPDTNPRMIPRPASPLSSSSRHRSPLRRPSDETYSSFGSSVDIDQTISENSELDLTPRAPNEFDSVPASPSFSSHQTFPRSRRRPASPLNPFASTPFAASIPRSTLRPSTSTPSLAGSQYNESYPSSYSMSSSSIPSTPTSLRSRSPSISSLETIPDSPDAEREAEALARLKEAVEKEEQGEEGSRRRAGTEVGSRSLGARDKRKRWSVCGAERRGDLNLETIWEN